MAATICSCVNWTLKLINSEAMELGQSGTIKVGGSELVETDEIYEGQENTRSHRSPNVILDMPNDEDMLVSPAGDHHDYVILDMPNDEDMLVSPGETSAQICCIGDLASQPESNQEDQRCRINQPTRQSEEEQSDYFHMLLSQQRNPPWKNEDSFIHMRQLHSETHCNNSVRCQGVPHGGDQQKPLYNTCPLDQFLNGLYQMCRSPPFRNQLRALAEKSPTMYRNLWEAVCLCEERQFAEAKSKLVPNVCDMTSTEGLTVMPLIENQLRHTKKCNTCKHSVSACPSLDLVATFKTSTGFQAVLKSTFSPQNWKCSQPGCEGQATVTVRFDSGFPPLIIAVNLVFLRNRIPNSHLNEVVNLFEERYMPFIRSFGQPPELKDGSCILGHYMSYVFRPEAGGNFDRDGRPVGNWYFYPNNPNGDLEPWTFDQGDPENTSPSMIYFIRIPSSTTENLIWKGTRDVHVQ